MAYEEVTSGGDFDEDREFVSAKIGATIEGTFRGMSQRFPSKYGDDQWYRVVRIDTTDGQKIAVRANRILLERVEAAKLTEGDGLRIGVESKTSKAGRDYANPRLYVSRGEGTPSPTAAASAPRIEDEPPF